MAVSILLARAVIEAVEAANVDRRDFLSRAGFDGERLERVDGRMELSEYDSLIAHALDATNDPALALHMLDDAAVSVTYNVTAHLVLHSSCLREAIESITRYHRLISDQKYWDIVEDEGTATIRYEGGAGPLRCRRFRSEFTVNAMCKMVQYFVRGALPLRVAFDYPAPPYSAEYGAIFQGRERFEQPFTGVVIGRELMDAPHINGDSDFHTTVEVQAARKLARIERATTHAEKVHDYVTANPSRQDMRSVGRALGMSPRSLRRRLAEEGTSYNAVVDRALSALATRLLVDEHRSIQEISHELCFSDASTFCRAFKRWTGATPKQYLALQEGRPGPGWGPKKTADAGPRHSGAGPSST